MSNTITYNEAVSEIEDILHEIENEEINVDNLSDKVKRVSFLIKQCKQKLSNTDEEVKKILEDNIK